MGYSRANDAPTVGPRGRDSKHAPPKTPPPASGVDDIRTLQRLIGNRNFGRIVERMAGEKQPRYPATDEVLSRPGKPVPQQLRTEAEAALNDDFSTVRIHEGATAQESAKEMGALVYTSAENIVLGAGELDRKTWLHEFRHVQQQRAGAVEGTDNGSGYQVSNEHDKHEREADTAAEQGLSRLANQGHSHATSAVQRVKIIQRASGIKKVYKDVSSKDASWWDTWLKTHTFEVEQLGPEKSSKRTNLFKPTAPDPRLAPAGKPHLYKIKVRWADVLDGEQIKLWTGTGNLYVEPQGSHVLRAAIDDLNVRIGGPDFSDPESSHAIAAEAMLGWIQKKLASSGGDKVIARVTERTDEDGQQGAQVSIEGRPAWQPPGDEIVTGTNEDRRHIIAWHTLREAFQNVLNEALKPGEDLEGRMKKLLALLKEHRGGGKDYDEGAVEGLFGGPAKPQEEAQEEVAEEEVGPEPSAAPAAGASAAPVTGVPSTPRRKRDMFTGLSIRSKGKAPAAAASTTLHDDIARAVEDVLRVMNSNPYNLWAGNATENQSINRVGQQLRNLMDKTPDDATLRVEALRLAQDKSKVKNNDQAVWTEAWNTLSGEDGSGPETESVSEEDDIRKLIESIIDTTDVDVPVRGQGPVSKTYQEQADQIATIKNILGKGIASEAVKLANNIGEMPEFDELLERLGHWLHGFLNPRALETTLAGARTVGARPQAD